MPTEIVGLLRKNITFRWPDGHESIIPARTLRLKCRCAQCVEEWSGKPLVEPSQIPDHLRAKGIQLVGQYGMSIEWSESPCANIYNFRDLRAMCPCDACNALREQGVTPGST
ncbi:MAG: DUF971 domain-containing protein [Deltaproteobacteria bacterium]|nr:DUF971 domain-containing protein [Deltaproteobacteria bacterium]